MKKLSILSISMLLGMILSSSLSIADEAKPNEPADAQQAEFMAKWQAYATPGEGHKVLDYFVGSWTYTIKGWASKDAPSFSSSGTCEAKWLMGGRFLEMLMKDTSKDNPFEGMAIIGYNNMTKEYTNVWIDTTATGMMIAPSVYDAETKTMTETGTFTDPVSGETKFRGVTKIVDDDKFTYELYIPGRDGKEFRMMLVEYTRSGG